MPNTLIIGAKLAYWAGVAQTDATLSTYFVKERNRKRPRLRSEIQLIVGRRSLPMLLRFRDISNELFDRTATFWKNKRAQYVYRLCAKGLPDLLRDLDIMFGPPIPPNWVRNSDKNFGAYIAGIIDGDGSTKLKNAEWRTPQCVVITTSGKEQYQLASLIEGKLRCKTSVVKRTKKKGKGVWYELSFYISRRTNLAYFEKYVLPAVTIPHKRNRIICKIELEWARSLAWIAS